MDWQEVEEERRRTEEEAQYAKEATARHAELISRLPMRCLWNKFILANRNTSLPLQLKIETCDRDSKIMGSRIRFDDYRIRKIIIFNFDRTANINIYYNGTMNQYEMSIFKDGDGEQPTMLFSPKQSIKTIIKGTILKWENEQIYAEICAQPAATRRQATPNPSFIERMFYW